MNFVNVIGHEDVKGRFLSALESERLHHGWMLEGLSGIGKSMLAKTFGMYLLGARGRGHTLLDFDASDPIVQKCLSGSHPDFRIIERELGDSGKLKQDISVQQIRDLIHFFELKPAMGGWRVGIIDSLDEMNKNAENALLKTLEEPSSNCALFLVNHGQNPVLPTIRSRCRVERLHPLSNDDTSHVLQRMSAPQSAITIACGRPGYAMKMSEPSGLKALDVSRAYLTALPKPPNSLSTSLLQAAAADATAFAAFEAEVLHWLATTAQENPERAGHWLTISAMLADSRKNNMDLTQTTAKVVAALSAAAQTV